MQFRRWTHPAILVGVLAIAARIIPGPRTIDDAYIIFRYAQNLLQGYGLVYNPGEAVLGITTPLYTLILAGLGSITGGAEAPFGWLALAVGAVADAATCALLIELGAKLLHPRAGIAAALVWAIAPWSVTFAIGGMETSLVVALLTATLYLSIVDRPVPAALAGGLAVLTRPDAGLLLLPLGIERLRRLLPRSRLNPEPLPVSLPEVVAFFGPVLLWAIAGTLLYGSPIPQSIAAKSVAYRLPAEAGLVRLLQHYATPFLAHLVFGTGAWMLAALMVYLFLFARGAQTGLRARPGSWPLFAYPWIYLLAFSIANPLIFRWYLTPPLPAYFLGIALGVDRIAADFKARGLTVGFGAVAFALTLNGWTTVPDHGPQRPAPEMAFIQLEMLYEQAGRSLSSRLDGDQVLAAGDIGALGYFSRARILDTVGLISPESVKYYPLPDTDYVINYAVPPKLILDRLPDVLVILEAYGRNSLIPDPAFREAYELEETLPTDLYGSEGMLIYTRRPPP